jgi:hypothetical protein
MELYFAGESIEAQKAQVYAKKVVPQALIKDQNLGTLRKYTLERDGAATVEQELTPKKPLYKMSSKVNLGDKIQCLKFFILTKELNLRFKKSPFSGAHNTNLANTVDFTFAEISHPFSHIVNAIQKRIEGKDQKAIS